MATISTVRGCGGRDPGLEGQARGAHREAVPARGDLRWWAIASGVVTVNAVLWRLLAHPGTIHGQEALKVGYALEYLLPFTAGLVTPPPASVASRSI